MRFRVLIGVLACLCLPIALGGCPSAHLPRPYPAPAPPDLVAHLAGVRERATSLNADTKTDVRLGKERVNVTVMMLAAWGGRLRFQALDPNSAMAADLASDGTSYCFLDVHAGCSECGAASAETVARLVRIPLEPEQVVAILLGSAPLLDGAETTVAWDPDGGHEVVTQQQGAETRRFVLDGRDRRWDLLSAEARAGGKALWSIRHKDFHDVKTKDGKTVRMPGASLFEQGGDTVRISWKDQIVGEPVDDEKFHLTPPAGLPQCGTR